MKSCYVLTLHWSRPTSKFRPNLLTGLCYRRTYSSPTVHLLDETENQSVRGITSKILTCIWIIDSYHTDCFLRCIYNLPSILTRNNFAEETDVETWMIEFWKSRCEKLLRSKHWFRRKRSQPRQIQIYGEYSKGSKSSEKFVRKHIDHAHDLNFGLPPLFNGREKQDRRFFYQFQEWIESYYYNKQTLSGMD